tara:strand:- start:493 stop:1254 length:762 start_codon:yes stop_codon:yes gene_type:complete
MIKQYKVGLVIQARVSSKRFPGKVMKNILGKPMIYRIYERVKLCKKIDTIVVSIPNNKSDDILFKFLKRSKINVFRGSELNLISRFYNTAKKYNFDYIVRLPADNPLPDYKQIDKLIKFHMKLKKNMNVFSTNLQPIKNSNYIDGIGAEIFSFKMLEKLVQNKNIRKNREHISQNFYNFEKKKIINKKYFRVFYPIAPKSISYPNIVLDVNYKKQFSLIKKIYKNIYPKNKLFLTNDIIKYLKKYEKNLFKNK